MQKTLIALVLGSIAGYTNAAPLVSPVVNGGGNPNLVYSKDGSNIFLGGRAEFRGDFNGNDDGTEVDGTMGDKSRIRINIGGTSEITDTLSAFGFYEAEQTTADGEDLDQRYAYVGLSSDNYGAVSVGRQNTANVQLSDMSDIGTYTGDQKAFIGAGNEQQTNTFAYTGQFNALRVNASYTAGEEADTDGYGLSAIYSFPIGIDIGLGYTDADKDQNQVTAGASYSIGGFYTGLTYTNGDTEKEEYTKGNKEDFEGYEFAAQYMFENNFYAIGAYQNQQVDDEDIADFFELTGGYNFNKHVSTYVAYKFNQLDRNEMNSRYQYNDDAEDSLRVGLKYMF